MTACFELHDGNTTAILGYITATPLSLIASVGLHNGSTTACVVLHNGSTTASV